MWQDSVNTRVKVMYKTHTRHSKRINRQVLFKLHIVIRRPQKLFFKKIKWNRYIKERAQRENQDGQETGTSIQRPNPGRSR